MALLSVENLCVDYRNRDINVRAVDDVSFNIEKGEVLALVGESGSGKSSVALSLTRLLPSPQAALSGAVIFDQISLLDSSESALRSIRGGRISYVFQDPSTSLNPVLTIGEQLAETLELHTDARGSDVERLSTEWLERVGIAAAAERLHAYPHEFSGGMQQRVCIAIAMAAKPELLVADEPTTALDVTVQVQILRLLRDLQKQFSLSVLLISHDLTVVERLTQRVCVLSKGRLVESGLTSQILRKPAHPYTQELLRCRSSICLRSGDAST